MKILGNKGEAAGSLKSKAEDIFVSCMCVFVCISKDTPGRWVYKRPEKDLVFECRSIVVDQILLYFGPTRIFFSFSFSFFLYTSVAFTPPFFFCF